MLNYQSHVVPRHPFSVRRLLNKRPTPEFDAWMVERAIWDYERDRPGENGRPARSHHAGPRARNGTHPRTRSPSCANASARPPIRPPPDRPCRRCRRRRRVCPRATSAQPLTPGATAAHTTALLGIGHVGTRYATDVVLAVPGGAGGRPRGRRNRAPRRTGRQERLSCAPDPGRRSPRVPAPSGPRPAPRRSVVGRADRCAAKQGVDVQPILADGLSAVACMESGLELLYQFTRACAGRPRPDRGHPGVRALRPGLARGRDRRRRSGPRWRSSSSASAPGSAPATACRRTSSTRRRSARPTAIAT
jgi:hypothetical protein